MSLLNTLHLYKFKNCLKPVSINPVYYKYPVFIGMFAESRNVVINKIGMVFGFNLVNFSS
jgi:hypothetical protein